MSPTPLWTARLDVALADPTAADWLEAALGPEASREVARGGASVERPSPTQVAVALWARDAGAMRAALNTYLGWVDLAVSTARAAETAAPDRP